MQFCVLAVLYYSATIIWTLSTPISKEKCILREIVINVKSFTTQKHKVYFQIWFSEACHTEFTLKLHLELLKRFCLCSSHKIYIITTFACGHPAKFTLELAYVHHTKFNLELNLPEQITDILYFKIYFSIWKISGYSSAYCICCCGHFWLVGENVLVSEHGSLKVKS